MPTLSAILCGDFKRASWIARTTQLLLYQSRYKRVDDVRKEPIQGRPEPNESGDLLRLLIFEMATGQGKTVPTPRISHFPLREGVLGRGATTYSELRPVWNWDSGEPRISFVGIAATLALAVEFSVPPVEADHLTTEQGNTDQMKTETTEATNRIASEHDTDSPIDTPTKALRRRYRCPLGNRRGGSIRFWLASLVVACVLPVWIAAGFLVYYDYQSRRALTEQRMLETARALTMVVDRELANMQASLSVLATSPSLASGDLPAFYRQARAVLEAHPGAYIILADATGQELINTFLPFGAPLPKHSVPDAVRQVFATGKPLITKVFKGVFDWASL